MHNTPDSFGQENAQTTNSKGSFPTLGMTRESLQSYIFYFSGSNQYGWTKLTRHNKQWKWSAATWQIRS